MLFLVVELGEFSICGLIVGVTAKSFPATDGSKQESLTNAVDGVTKHEMSVAMRTPVCVSMTSVASCDIVGVGRRASGGVVDRRRRACRAGGRAGQRMSRERKCKCVVLQISSIFPTIPSPSQHSDPAASFRE